MTALPEPTSRDQPTLRAMITTLEKRARADSRVVVSAQFAREAAQQLRRLLGGN